jgi:uncharacterized protein
MKVTMHAMSVDVFVPMLASLRGCLEKGAAFADSKKIKPEVLLQSRLAPDMFPLLQQVQLACDFAKNSSARLAGQEPVRFPDEEGTFDELYDRMARTLEYVRGMPASAFEGAEERQITLPLRDRTMKLNGLHFLQRFALPNFFFHVTTAYDILRHSGVGIGKRDFVGDV